jgi:pimeloyl-ACP methyl ester carboxylesterase
MAERSIQVDGAELCTESFGAPAAHLIGVSAGAGIAQVLAFDHPGRVRSCVLISTTRAVPGRRELPPPTDEFMRFLSTAEVDWSSKGSVVEYLVEYIRVLAGAERPFDESAARDLVCRDVARAHDIAAIQNHGLLAEGDRQRAPLGSIEAPVLVVHGTADPMFPLAHGEALADEIPGARLLTLSGAGHGIYRDDWETLAGAIAEHTAD